MSSAPRKILLTLLLIGLLAGAALYYLSSNLNDLLKGFGKK
jgi:CRISPR/Cas system-associated protein Csm6